MSTIKYTPIIEDDAAKKIANMKKKGAEKMKLKAAAKRV